LKDQPYLRPGGRALRLLEGSVMAAAATGL
jgi:hypothetical protein